MQPLHCGGNRDDLLDDPRAEQRRQQAGAGSGDDDPVASGGEATVLLHAGEELQRRLGLPRVVPLIVPPQRLAVLDGDRLQGRRADVEADDHDARRPPRWSTRFAAVPTHPPCGTRQVADLMAASSSTRRLA